MVLSQNYRPCMWILAVSLALKYEYWVRGPFVYFLRLPSSFWAIGWKLVKIELCVWGPFFVGMASDRILMGLLSLTTNFGSIE